MMNLEYNGHTLRLFAFGMYCMLCLIYGTRFVMKARECINQDARIAYRLAYISLFLLVGLILLSLGITDFFYLDYQPHTWVIIQHLITLCDLMVLPFAGLMMIHLTHAYEVTLKRSLVHTVPFVVLFIYYFLTFDEKVFRLSYCVSLIYGAVIYLFTLTRVYIYQKALQKTYSDPGSRSLKWVYLFVNIFLLQNVLYYFLSKSENKDWPHTIYYLMSIVNWWALAEMLGRQVLDVDEMKEQLKVARRRDWLKALSEDDKPAAERPADTTTPIDRELQRLCAEEKIYLNPELSCNDLAKAVGTNRTYMSLWFREHGTTFNDYINSLRLKQAEHLLRTTDENILTIGSRSGFNHPNTFRNVFKEYFGCTPKDYRKKLKEED